MKYFLPNACLILTMFALAMTSGCKEEIAQPLTATLQLVAEGASVSEAFLRIHANVPRTPWILLLKRDQLGAYFSEPIDRSSFDTLIDDNLLYGNQTYTYKAYYLYNLIVTDSSAPATVTTLGGTSHSFIWQMDTVGIPFATQLFDVSIINDTCVWAVGSIIAPDSAGGVPRLHNAAKWDGGQWTLQTISYLYQGNLGSEALRAIDAFSQTDIWVAGSDAYHWNGATWQQANLNSAIFHGDINKFWGTSSSDLYIVGTNGSLAHYDGTDWKKIDAGTTLDFQDIWGAKNSRSGETEIIAAASNWSDTTGYQRDIIKISGSTTTSISDSGIYLTMHTVWFVPGLKYYIAGVRLFANISPIYNAPWSVDNESQFSSYDKFSMRGNGLNDIVIAGQLGEILHFNGSSWVSYYPATHFSGNYYAVAIRNNLIVAVGDQGVIAIGHR
jgi:hypothetical protein